jgi:hypothetical protein
MGVIQIKEEYFCERFTWSYFELYEAKEFRLSGGYDKHNDYPGV